jgi:beta-lactamase class A
MSDSFSRGRRPLTTRPERPQRTSGLSGWLNKVFGAPSSRQRRARSAAPTAAARRSARSQVGATGDHSPSSYSAPSFSASVGAPTRTRTPSARRQRARATWPPQHQRDILAKLPAAPKPVVLSIQLLIVGLGVAVIAGTLLSVLMPENSKPGVRDAARTASQTESALAAPERVQAAQGLPLTQEVAPLKAKLTEIQESIPGFTPAVFWLDLDSGKYVDLNGQQPLAAASTIKLPILIAFFEKVDAGQITLDQTLMMKPEQVAGGSGDMQAQPPGTQFTALEVATQMIVNSDNTATNMMIELLGGSDTLNERFVTWGLTGTALKNPLPDLSGTNTTSPQDLVYLMTQLHQGKLVSLRSRDRILGILLRTYNKTLIPSGVGEGTLVYNKTGDIATMLSDIALVDLPNGKRYALAVLVQRPSNDGRARELIRRISQATFQEMNPPKLGTTNTPTDAAPATPGETSAAPSSPEVDAAATSGF